VLICNKFLLTIGARMQKISENKIRKQGIRGFSITFPKVMARDNNLEPGDVVEIYRDRLEGKDAIIIIPQSKEQSVSSTPVSN